MGPINPLVGSAMISAGGSLLGGLFGIGNQRATIKAQQAMQREQNAWQTSEREAAQRWNLDMWNRENEYNSATAQRQRLEDAGLNPYMMMSGGDAGSASSLTTSPMSAAASPSYGTYDIGGNIQSAFNQVAQQLYGYQLQKSEIDKNRAQESQFSAEALLTAAKTKSEDAFRPYLIDNLYTQGDQMRADIHNKQEEADLKHSQMLYYNLENTSKTIMNKYLDAEKQVQFLGLVVGVNNAYLQGRLTKAQTREAMSAAFNLYFSGMKNKKEYELLRDTFDTAVQRMNAYNMLEAANMEADFNVINNIGFENYRGQPIVNKFLDDNWKQYPKMEKFKWLHKPIPWESQRPFAYPFIEKFWQGKYAPSLNPMDFLRY